MRLKATHALGAAVLVGAMLTGVLSSQASASDTALSHKKHTEVVVRDIEIPVPGQQTITAYVVRPDRPARPRSLAGVLYLHWFAPPGTTQNRTEFLAEAVDLAGRGGVAILPQLRFPWEGDPVGDARDREAITAQLAAVTRAYQTLLAQPGVDPHRTAVVGHDYGAMYGAILAQRDPRVHAGVFMAADATWANWFDTYWLGLPEDQKPGYRALFAGLDPVDNVSRLGARLFLQWGDRDQFITPEVRDAFAAANPAAKTTLYTRTDHAFNQPAKDERVAWLNGQLGLA